MGDRAANNETKNRGMGEGRGGCERKMGVEPRRKGEGERGTLKRRRTRRRGARAGTFTYTTLRDVTALLDEQAL